MKPVLLWLRFLAVLGLLISASTIDSIGLANRKPAEAMEEKQREDVPRICPQDLPAAIENIINRPEFKRSRWGIEIQTLDGNSLYSLNAEQFFAPASSVKLLTTAAVLSQLGANEQIVTPIFGSGNPPNLTSLRLKGQGDPTISTKKLKTIVHQLQAQGVKQIENLIIDDSYFGSPAINPTWEWFDIHSYFATAVNSTILNQNTVTLTLLPQKIGQPVQFFWSDAIAAKQWRIINQGVTGAADIPYNIEIEGDLGQPVLTISGELAVNETADIWDLAVVDPANYFLESLRLHFAQAGIKVTRGIVVNQSSKNDAETELTTITSEPMEQILATINQESNNLYAEAVAKVLAQKLATKTPIDSIVQSLTQLGISSKEYVLVDGSGLSRQNLVTPKTLVKTLKLMSQSPQGKSYRQSLAIAGVNGTLKNRFKNTPVAGNLWGKTGALTGVNSLAGYLLNSQDQTIIFSILLNNSELSSPEIRQTIDQIVVILNKLYEC